MSRKVPSLAPILLSGLALLLLPPASYADSSNKADAKTPIHLADNQEAAGTGPATVEPPARPRKPNRPTWAPAGHGAETDAAKCDLARRILSGKVRHPSGTPIDRYDREVAERDVRNFCR